MSRWLSRLCTLHIVGRKSTDKRPEVSIAFFRFTLPSPSSLDNHSKDDLDARTVLCCSRSVSCKKGSTPISGFLSLFCCRFSLQPFSLSLLNRSHRSLAISLSFTLFPLSLPTSTPTNAKKKMAPATYFLRLWTAYAILANRVIVITYHSWLITIPNDGNDDPYEFT